jgi:hypothetical protein
MTSYEPDAEYVDGRIIQRSAAQFDHGGLQAQLAAYFYAREKEWNVIGVSNTRVQTAASALPGTRSMSCASGGIAFRNPRLGFV